MLEHERKFHEFAIKSILFKGHTDLYFCYLKAEKIAHVLSILQQRSGTDSSERMNALVSAGSRLPETILHFAAGEIDMTIILADVFSILTALRLNTSQQVVSTQNSAILSTEYEQLAERIAAGSRLSPFITSDDLLLPSLPNLEDATRLLPAQEAENILRSQIKDNKGQVKNQKDTVENKGQSKGHSRRTTLILELVRKHKSLSIRDIAKVIRDCSEKTIQRELALLIHEGLLVKHGERRWSVYSPA